MILRAMKQHMKSHSHFGTNEVTMSKKEIAIEIAGALVLTAMGYVLTVLVFCL